VSANIFNYTKQGTFRNDYLPRQLKVKTDSTEFIYSRYLPSNRNEIMSYQFFFLPLNLLKGTFAIYKCLWCLQLKPLQGFGVKKHNI